MPKRRADERQGANSYAGTKPWFKPYWLVTFHELSDAGHFLLFSDGSIVNARRNGGRFSILNGTIEQVIVDGLRTDGHAIERPTHDRAFAKANQGEVSELRSTQSVLRDGSTESS